MLDPTADQLHQQHAYFEDGIAHAVRRAGQGPDAVLERRLVAQARGLQAMLDDPRGARLALEVAEAARRAMDAAQPDAPLHLLGLARENLARIVRRRAFELPRGREAA